MTTTLAKSTHRPHLFNPTQIKQLCLDALKACDNAAQKCLAAGQALNEAKAVYGHGDFMETVAKLVPEISHKTATTWMRAAENITHALPPLDGTINIESISELLSTPDSELNAAAREWKQGWFDFTADKTIKECLNGVLVEGDADHRIDRAINGKTKGGSGGDRKDFPLFVAVKLKDMGVHLGHWKNMTETQKTEAKTALIAAITGDSMNLRKRNFNFELWPDEICDVVAEAIRARKKGAKQ